MDLISEEQLDELEALKAIFEEYFIELSSRPPCFIIRVAAEDVPLTAPLSLKVTFTREYPETPPILEIPNRSQILSAEHTNSLLNHLNSLTEDSDEAPPPPLEGVRLEEAKVTGGRWDLVIGLVGKPSAGKSTFFNAATALDMAKTGAHPFTTIEPNIGRAFYTIPCPCARLHTRCDAAHGHDSRGDRFLSVLLKDVAGLVPGACDGKGRGNRFLNDLCDADVLMHIVDVSGSTNESGEATSGYDPCLDVQWLQQEIHRWIFDNVMDKWESIVKRPGKLVDMFTGYHASRATIHSVLQAAGIGELELASIATWEEAVLQRIVRQFVSTRFPIFLALNKADTEQAPANILKIRQRFCASPSLPVSAHCETQLQQLHRQATVLYEGGAAGCQKAANYNPATDDVTLQYIETNVWSRYKSTNVTRALSEAVSLKQPLYAFPVTDLDTLTSIDKFKGEAAGSLRDCVTLKPPTTCEELYTAMLHYPLQLCAGDFIRAECVTEGGEKRILRKHERLATQCHGNQVILKVMTNRKVTQVKRR